MTRSFSKPVVAAIDRSQILGVRAGTDTNHRFIGVWVVVVGGRIFVRSWTLKEGGWYRTLREEPLGTIQVGGRTLRVRAVPVHGERTRDAVDEAYAKKYATPAAQKYVRGFRSRRRRDTTTELRPR